MENQTKELKEVLPTMQTMNQSLEVLKVVDIELFKKVVYSVCPEFVVDGSNKNLMNSIFHYINGRSEAFDPSKGILLWGSIGTGKSTIIKIIGELLRINGHGYKTINCSTLANQFAANGLDALNESTYNDGINGHNPVNRAFDELGREPIPARHYGNELNVMQYVFQCRYELRGLCKTFVTTNAQPQGLSKLYGSYIYDRIGDMFNIIELKGKSRRNGNTTIRNPNG